MKAIQSHATPGEGLVVVACCGVLVVGELARSLILYGGFVWVVVS